MLAWVIPGQLLISFFFFLSLSPSLNFFNQKDFIGALEKQTQHTAVSFVTEPIKNEIH